MLKNYFLIAWRHLSKNKGFTAINIAGLAIGMAITLLIGVWIADELAFDHYHRNHGRLAEVLLQQEPKGQKKYTGPVVAPVTGQVLDANYGDLFRKTAMSMDAGDHLLDYGDKQVSRHVYLAQHTLPEIFTFKMLTGTTGAMQDPSTALVSRKVAAALFGEGNPVNKVLKLDNRLSFKIGGVYEDLPGNSTFHDADILLPWTNNEFNYLSSNTDWNYHGVQLYVLMADNVSTKQATVRIKNLPTAHITQWLEELMVYPLDKMHLHGEFANGEVSGGRIQFVLLFGLIGGFVLLLACINFMNLSTARSEQRAKEVGIRKTIGSLRAQLIGQFLGESVLVAFLSFILALLLARISMPWFNALSGKELFLPFGDPLFWTLALSFTLLTGLLAGSYPAFYLSGFDAVKVLKGTFRVGRFASVPRKILVVTQFTVSLALIIATIIVFRQIEFAKDRPIGYTREGLVTVYINTPELSMHYDALRADLLATGVVANMAESSQPTTFFGNNNNVTWEGKTPEQGGIFFRNINVTPEFGSTIGWTVVAGRDFSREYATDSDAVVLNETSASLIGWKGLIGRQVGYGEKMWTVIGVVKNMLTNSPYENIDPAIFLGGGGLGVITLRIKAGTPVRTALSRLEPVFKKHDPASPFQYRFNDDDYAAKFESESRVGNLATVFSCLAIFISCLGLFGLASFVAEQRTKEIGVRKVLGANVLNLWGLLSKDFVKLVILSMFIAMPLAYWAMHKWLENYRIQTPLSWWIFAASGAGILLVTLLTVSYQSLKAALMNPVKSLRRE